MKLTEKQLWATARNDSTTGPRIVRGVPLNSVENANLMLLADHYGENRPTVIRFLIARALPELEGE